MRNNVALNVGSIDKTEYKDFSGGISDDRRRDFEAEFLAMAIARSMPHCKFSKIRIENNAGRLGKRKIELPIPDDRIVSLDNTRTVMHMLNKAVIPRKVKMVKLSDIIDRPMKDDSYEFFQAANDRPRSTRRNLSADSGLISFFEFCRINMDSPVDPIDKGLSLHWNIDHAVSEYVSAPASATVSLDDDTRVVINNFNRYVFRQVFSDSDLSNALETSDYWNITTTSGTYTPTWYSYSQSTTYATNAIYV